MTYEGPAVFRAPFGNSAAQDNFRRTVLEGIEREEVADLTDAAPERQQLRLWGTKETVSGTWKNIDPGDFLLFYRDDSYEYAAEVISTEENEALGRHVWPNFEEDSPWSCIIYLEEPVEIGVDSSEIHELAGYDIDYPMGFSPLNEMGVGGIRGRYGSVESFVYGTASGTDLDLDREPHYDIPPSILDDLYFPEGRTSGSDQLLTNIEDALNAGKHIVFTGPPGTGKTELAERTAAYVSTEHPDVYTGYELTTATADWSTFETVGGYMPDEDDGGDLGFTPGQVLECFKVDGRQRNDLLVIDEINRSDIDKSFGQLFTLLSGQSIKLPFTKNGSRVEILPGGNIEGKPDSHEFIAPNSWRIFATMNSYDKASLYEMSYAFMRRFAFIYVGAPEIPDDSESRSELIEEYADVWGIEVGPSVRRKVGEVWYLLNVQVDERPIGPAIVRDVLAHVSRSDADSNLALTDAIASYVFPQLEGVRRREQVVSALFGLEHIQEDRLRQVASDVLQANPDG